MTSLHKTYINKQIDLLHLYDAPVTNKGCILASDYYSELFRKDSYSADSNYERIMNENSDDGVGDSTVKTRYTVVPSPTTAQADSDYGFSETFEFFEPSKNFDPVTGADFSDS